MVSCLLLGACSEAEVPGTVPSESARGEKKIGTGYFSMALTDEFSPVGLEGYELCYFKKGMDVYVLREDFSLAEELPGMTLEEYAASMIEGNGLDNAAVKKDGDLVYYEYAVTVEEASYSFLTYVFKTDRDFWVVQFAVPTEERNDRFREIQRYAASVSFSI